MLALGRTRKLPRVVSTWDLDRLLRTLPRTAAIDAGADPRAALRRPDEATTLLAVALMVATGARVNEVVSICCDDLDLPARSFRIVGKGRRERHVFLPNDWLVGLTDAYIRTRAGLGIEYPQLLFNLRRQPLTAAAMRSRLVNAARDAALCVV